MTALERAARVVHRYCGRQHGGHCEVARSEALDALVEPLVHRRSDLAGEDLGHPVPPYFSGYPLPDGRYAFARTRYLEDADCLGAVRTESLLLAPAQQRQLPHPLCLRASFDEPPDLGPELEAIRGGAGPQPLPARDLDPLTEDAGFPALLALPDTLLVPLLHAWCGSTPLALIDGTPELLAELLRLAPNPWGFGLCTQALSHRDWARLEAVPAEAAERVVLRAARERDLAVVDLRGRSPQGVAPSELGAWVHARLRAGEQRELLALVARAREVSAYAVPADLAAQRRFEELAAKSRSPDEVIEHVNHLKVRGAPPSELAAAFAPLLGSAPEGRAGFTLNVLRNGWLPTGADDAAAEDALGGLLEQAAEEGAARAILAFLQAADARYPRARARGLVAVGARLAAEEPLAEREDDAWRELAEQALEVAPAQVARALAARAPWLSQSELDRLLSHAARRELPEAAWLDLVDAAARTAPATFASAVRAAGARPALRPELGRRVAAQGEQDPSLVGELTAAWELSELGPLLRGLSPAAGSTAGEVLRERIDSVERWDQGGGRALARLATPRRGDPSRASLAREHGLHLFRAQGARPRLLELARRKAAAGARAPLLQTLDALAGPTAGDDAAAWVAVLEALSLPLDDALAARLPAPAWSLGLDALAPRVPAPPLPPGPLASRLEQVAAAAAAGYVEAPGDPAPASAPWLAWALADLDAPPERWVRAAARVAPDLAAGPARERLRAAAEVRAAAPEVDAADLEDLAADLGSPRLNRAALAHALDGPGLDPEGRPERLARAAADGAPDPVWTRVGRAVREGALDPADLRLLPAAPLGQALDALEVGFSMRIQTGLQRLVQALAGGGDSAALAVALRATLAHTKSDRELRARLAAQVQAALAESPVLATAEVEEAVRALAAR